MSQIPSDPDTNHNRRRAVTYDELIAMFVAFLTLGSVLFWGLTRSGMNLFGNAGLLNLDGASSFIEELDSRNPLDTSADIVGNLDAERNGVGLGGAEALRSAGTENRLSDRNRTDQGAEATSPSQPVPSQPATIAPVPSLPKQEAQPAEEPSAQSAEEPTEQEPNVAAAPAAQIPIEASREAIKFQDVPDDYWAKPYIDALSERVIISGLSDDAFAPDQPVTRAQLASAIAQAFSLGSAEATTEFSDVEADYWAMEAIDKSVKGGFMTGFPDESFQPALPIPRAQVLTALVTGLNTAVPENAPTIVGRYNDAANIPEWAVGKMAAATQANIVVNYPNLDSLNPNQPATRAEVAAMIYQALAAQGRIDDIGGEYVVKP